MIDLQKATDEKSIDERTKVSQDRLLFALELHLLNSYVHIYFEILDILARLH